MCLLHGKLKMATGNFSVEEELNVIFEDENYETPTTKTPNRLKERMTKRKVLEGKNILV